MTKSAVSNAKKIATKFFGSERTPPPSEIFRKFIHFGIDRLPLAAYILQLVLLVYWCKWEIL